MILRADDTEFVFYSYISLFFSTTAGGYPALQLERSTFDLGDLSNNKQQQQNFINKQIKLQKYCPQLARLLEAGQCV